MSTEEDKARKLRDKITNWYARKYGGSSNDDVLVYLTEKLIKGTDRLNILTIVLIVLTIILAALTGIYLF